MSTALVPLADIERLATMLSKSALLPEGLRGKVADIAVTVMAGQELGLSPMAALRGIHVVSGKPVLSADMMVALVHRSGKCEFFECIESTATIATYETKRQGARSPQRLSFTIEQAKKAGLAGPNWSKYPDAMLRARAKSALARDVFGDVLAGCYEEDEARDFEPTRAPATVSQFRAPTPREKWGDGEPDIVDAEYTEQPNMAEQIEAAESIADLGKLVATLSKLPNGPEKDVLRRAYGEKRAALLKPKPAPDPEESFYEEEAK